MHQAVASDKEPACQCRRCKRPGFDPWVRKIPWRRAWQPTPLFLPGEFHGERNLVGYNPYGRKELDTTAYTHVHQAKALSRHDFLDQCLSFMDPSR